MYRDWDDEDADAPFDCPFCDGELADGVMVDRNDRGHAYFYTSLVCNSCTFNALTAEQYQAKLAAKNFGA